MPRLQIDAGGESENAGTLDTFRVAEVRHGASTKRLRTATMSFSTTGREDAVYDQKFHSRYSRCSSGTRASRGIHASNWRHIGSTTQPSSSRRGGHSKASFTAERPES